MKSRSLSKIETKTFSQYLVIKTRFCGTVGCEVEVKRKGGCNSGKGWDRYCKNCRVVRSRAKRDGVNPDPINKELLFKKYWCANGVDYAASGQN